MSTNKLQSLRCLLTERLAAAVEEMFGEVEVVVQSVVEENRLLHQTLSALRHETRFHRADELFSASPAASAERPSEQRSPGPAGWGEEKQEEPWLVRVKEEQEEQATGPGGGGGGDTDFVLSPAPVKSDVDQDDPPGPAHGFRVVKVESDDDDGSRSTFSAVDMASGGEEEEGTPDESMAPGDPTQPTTTRQKKGKKCSRCQECNQSLKKKGGKAASKKKKVKRPMQKTMLEFPRKWMSGDFTAFDDVRLDATAHWMVMAEKKGRCKFPGCKGFPKNKCGKCGVHLCFTGTSNCFLRFHTE